VIFRRVSSTPERWSFAPRQPSAAIYERAHASVKIAPPTYRKRVTEQDEYQE
jgi:hypothetical protein